MPIELTFLQVGAVASLIVTYRIAEAEEREELRTLRAFLPWAVLIVGLSLAGVWLLLQAMEMRGTFLAG